MHGKGWLVMKHKIKSVRHSIRRRRKKRESSDRSNVTDFTPLHIPKDEERFGYYTGIEYEEMTPNTKYKFNKIWIRLMMSVMLFFGITFLLKMNHERFATPKQLMTHYLQEEFPFAKVNDWYVSTLGNPLALFPEEHAVDQVSETLSLPVIGNVTEPFNQNGKGILISPTEQAVVSSFDRGVVIFAGNDQQTNKTVIVQHPDNSKTTYGHLSVIDVHLYEFINANTRIGTFQPSKESETVYFSIEQNNHFIDPIQVIQVDKKE